MSFKSPILKMLAVWIKQNLLVREEELFYVYHLFGLLIAVALSILPWLILSSNIWNQGSVRSSTEMQFPDKDKNQ